MTASTTATTTDGTRSLRTAGIMFLIVGVATPVQIALFEWSLSIDSGSGNYVPSAPSFVVALFSTIAGIAVLSGSIIGFALLFAWKPGPLQAVFFVPAVGSFLGVYSWGFSPQAEFFPAVVIGLGAILSGVVVFHERMFLTAGSLIFLLAMIAAQAPIAGAFIDPVSSVPTFELHYILGPCYVVCGLAMIYGARARAKLIEAGRIAR